MQLSRQRWGSLAYILAGAILALVRLVAWLTVEEGPMVAGIFDAGHLLAFSVAASGLSELGQVLQQRWRSLPWVGLVAICCGIGAIFLQDDVDGFSRRQELVPRAIAYWGAVGAISMMVPFAAAVGTLLDRSRLRALAVGTSIVVVMSNGLLLQNDYWGVHLFVGWAALVLAGAALRGATGRPEKMRRVPVLVASCILVLPVVFVQPPARAAAVMANSTGASFSPLFRFMMPRSELAAVSLGDSPWLRSRAEAPDVPPTQERPLGESPLVVLVTVDALRADVVLNEENDEQLPTLARLRDEGISFSRARAPGTLTKTSVSSLFMGTYFSQQYWSPMERFNDAMTVHADDSVRFTQLLRKAKTHTANFRAISWLRNSVVMRGFKVDEHVEDPKKRSYYTHSPPVMKRVRKEVRRALKNDRPTFVYCHLADPHAPYDLGKKKGGSSFSRYLSEVALVDSELGRLVRLLQRSKKPNSVLLIVSADHGEAFGEHRSKTHGTTMYDEALRVPLIFWRPGGSAAQVDDLVSVIDLGPTILDVFGVATPGHYMGQSLVPYLNGQRPELTRPIIAETRLMRSLVTPDRLKLIVDTRSGRQELYDLKKDPKELENLADDDELLARPWSIMERFFAVHTLKRDGYEPPFVK